MIIFMLFNDNTFSRFCTSPVKQNKKETVIWH